MWGRGKRKQLGGGLYYYDFVFLLSSRKNEQLFGSDFDSEVSCNMALIGKINIWDKGPGVALVETRHCVKSGVQLQGKRPQGQKQPFMVLHYLLSSHNQQNTITEGQI